MDLLFQELGALVKKENKNKSMEEIINVDKPKPHIKSGSVKLEEAILYCDGASRGNPGAAGIGMVIETPEGDEVFAWGEFIGNATNNVAEYKAMIHGLYYAHELGVKHIEVRADSQLIVRQINGIYKVKSSKLKPLYHKACARLDQFDTWRINHIERSLNSKADKLASDNAKGGKSCH